MPHLVEMQEKFGAEDFNVVGVMQGDEDEARRFIDELGATYPILTGASATFDNWGVTRIPQAYLIDPSGKVVADSVDDVPALLNAAR